MQAKDKRGYIQINQNILSRFQNALQRGIYQIIMEFSWVNGHDENRRAIHRNPCFASLRTISKKARVSINTVAKVLRELEQLGVIYIIRRPRKTNEIHIIDNPDDQLTINNQNNEKGDISVESENLEDASPSLLSVQSFNGGDGRRQQIINQIKIKEEKIKGLKEKYRNGEIGGNMFRDKKWRLEDEINALKNELKRLEGGEKEVQL